MAHHAVEAGIIEHDQTTLRILFDHADIFPDLHGEGALADFGINHLIGFLRPAVLAEARHGKRSSEVEMSGIGSLKGMSDPSLLAERREIGIVDIDRQNFKPVLSRNLEEGAIIRIGMDVRIEFAYPCEIGIG